MKIPPLIARLAGLFVGTGLFWLALCATAGVAEPWDAPGYGLLAYPASLILSGLAGRGMGRAGWMAGIAVTFSQAPVMVALSGPDRMIPLALLILTLLSLPATAIAGLAGWRGRRTG